MPARWSATACRCPGSAASDPVAQFDVFRLDDGTLVIDLQTDLIGLDASRLVAPLREEGAFAHFPLVTPVVMFDGRNWIVRLQELAAVPARELGTPLGSLREHRDVLKRGIDILIDGF